MASLAARFDALVDRSGPHHRWLGATDQHGVPQMRVNGRLTTARRVAWELRHGPLPVRPGTRLSRRSALRTRRPPDRRRATPFDRARRARRRRRGGGSVRELRPGVWKLTITIEPHRRVSRTISGDRRRAETELARLATEHGQPPRTVDALVLPLYRAPSEAGRSAATVRRYEQLWRTWLAPHSATWILTSCGVMISKLHSGRWLTRTEPTIDPSSHRHPQHHIFLGPETRTCCGQPGRRQQLPDGTVLNGSRQR